MILKCKAFLVVNASSQLSRHIHSRIQNSIWRKLQIKNSEKTLGKFRQMHKCCFKCSTLSTLPFFQLTSSITNFFLKMLGNYPNKFFFHNSLYSLYALFSIIHTMLLRQKDEAHVTLSVPTTQKAKKGWEMHTYVPYFVDLRSLRTSEKFT